MRLSKIFAALCLAGAASLVPGAQAWSQTAAKPAAAKPGKFAALAVDRAQGFIFGFAYDQPSREAAGAFALEECSKRKGSCALVVEIAGEGCASYHTVSAQDGSAYGWGTGPTQQVAEANSRKFCNEFADGKASCGNHAWTCNSADVAPFKVLREDPVKPKPGKNDCLVRFELDAETDAGDNWHNRYDSPVYRLSAPDCPSVGPDEYHGFSKRVYQGKAEVEEDNPVGARNAKAHARGIAFAENFYSWMSTRRAPDAGTHFRSFADVAVTTMTDKNLKDLLTTVGQSDSQRVHGICLGYLPPGVVPVATHGAEKCRQWVR